MEQYYKATIERVGDTTNFTVKLESARLGGEWVHHITKPAFSAGHGQEIAEQMRIARNATNYAFSVSVDCR